MAENLKSEYTESDPLSSSWEALQLEEMGTQKISVSDQTNSLQSTNIQSDNFIVNMDRFAHPADKDITPNSRVTLQRSLSRKGPQRGGEKNMNSGIGNERDVAVVAMSSPRAAGASTPEKSMVVTVGTTDHPVNPHVHHQITIMTGSISGGTTTANSKWGGGRFSFRRPPPSLAIDPRRILLFFATLSSLGTLLLIYFTLSMSKPSEDDNALNW